MNTPLDTNPPSGYWGVLKRLLRAYGPVAALILAILAVAAFVETKVPTDDGPSLAGRSVWPFAVAGALIVGVLVLAAWVRRSMEPEVGDHPPLMPGSPQYFSTWQRALRGYGPLAVLIPLVLILAAVAPSKVPEEAAAVDIVNTGVEVGDGPITGDPAPGIDPETGGGDGGTTGGTTGGTGGDSGGTAGGPAGPAAPGVTTACPDGRNVQVPGDPYSPPCVHFQGDNGGATHRGVTGDTIKVSYRSLNEKGFQQTLASLASADLVDTPATIQRTVEALADYFNQRFQFYGRQIEINFYPGQGANTTELLGGGRDKAEADAIRVADEIGAFADLSGTSEPYAGALASRGVIAFGTPYLSRKWHEERAPYAWSIAVDGTRVASLASEYAVKRLVNKNADFAAGELKGKPRKFATLAPENSWYQESVEVARKVVSDAGHDPGVNVKYQLNLGTMSNQATNIVAQLKREGVTTVICGCDPILPVFISGVADRERYYPEFIIAGTALTDFDLVGQLWKPSFAAQAFGVSPNNQFVPPTETIAYQAYKSVRQDEPAFSVDLIYYQMYELAIGIQGAGPNLNPQTFEQGMFNYPARTGPVGTWSFGPGDRTGTDDVREIYWSNDAASGYNGKKGTYLGTTGERWAPGQIPAGNPGKPVQ